MPYSIIGGDGNRYGPVEMDVLVQWARDGRVVPTTGILDHNNSRNFLAKDLAELAPVFAPPPHVSSPAQAIRQMHLPQYVLVPGTTVDQFGRPLKNKYVAGLLGIFLGGFGVHRFYLGYNGIGTLQLLMSLILWLPTCGLSLLFAWIWGLVDGVLCLTGGMTDSHGNPLIG